VAEDTVQASEFDPLRPEYREAAETMEQALSEACDSKPADEADTGELIRVEEMLAIAGEAARRVISIRQKARSDKESARTPQGTGDRTVDQAALTHRLFEDERGVSWDVWAVYPEAGLSQTSALPATFQTGWLVFESAGEKRRLSPIPNDWQSMTPNELQRLCQQADVAPRRTRPPRSGRGDGLPPPRE
jgi:hypothetical protein